MNIIFQKYQGTGNDFIIIDNRDGSVIINKDQIEKMCNRRFGIGADGLMLLNAHPDYDFEMKYYNSDGNESSMCGNGGRCLVKFASEVGIVRTDYKFIATDGEHQATINLDGTVSLKMNDVEKVEYVNGNYVLNTGSPHFVSYNDNVWQLDVVKKGREIRFSPEYKQEGINVNFVEETEEPDVIKVRTYERGVENETLSCGTGVTAAAIVSYHNDNGFNRVEVKTKGGDLSVEFDKIGDRFENVWLNGPAEKVFEGEIEIL